MNIIFLQAKQVIDLAENFLEISERDIAKQKEQLIQIKKAKWNRRINYFSVLKFLGLAGNRKNPSVEETFKEEFYEIELTGAYWRTQAKQLIKIASLDKSARIRVDADMAEILANYQELRKIIESKAG